MIDGLFEHVRDEDLLEDILQYRGPISLSPNKKITLGKTAA